MSSVETDAEKSPAVEGQSEKNLVKTRECAEFI